MPMTLDQIVEETSRLPRQQMAELVDRLTLSLHQSMEPSIESAWKDVVVEHVAGIRSGDVEGVPGEEISYRIAKIVGR